MFTGPNKPSPGHSMNQSPSGLTTPPTGKKCDMKIMYKHVVNKLSPHWKSVGDYLEYSVVERNGFRRGDDKKSLVALLENWIDTDNGREPKTWLTFIKVLGELDQDLDISVGSEIRTNLEKEIMSPSGKLFVLLCVQFIAYIRQRCLLRMSQCNVMCHAEICHNTSYVCMLIS